MLHMIGLIFKIIGLILAVILGILLIFLCILLFVPARYEGNAEFPGTFEEISADFKMTWFLHLICVTGSFQEKKGQWQIRVGWKRFGGKEEETEISMSSKPKEETEAPMDLKPKEEVKAPMDLEPKEEAKASVGSKPEEVQESSASSPVELREENMQKIPEQIEDTTTKTKEKTGFWAKIKYTFAQICDKIKKITDIKKKAVEFLEDPGHRNAFARLKKEGIWLVRFLKPKKYSLTLHYGLEDPGRTGQILAVLSMLYPFMGEEVEIYPDFEKQILEGKTYIKGGIRLIYPVIFGVKMLTDKYVRKTFQDVKNIKVV